VTALGHKRTFCDVRVMSALPPKADIDRRHLNVRFVPLATKRTAANRTYRDSGEPRGSSPPTPSYIRVRIRRFGRLSGHVFPQEGRPPGFGKRVSPRTLRSLHHRAVGLHPSVLASRPGTTGVLPNGFSRSPERPCLHYVVMSSPIPSKLQLHIISAAARQWPHLPELLSLQRNPIIALRCRRVGAVHSIISGRANCCQSGPMSAMPPIAPNFARQQNDAKCHKRTHALQHDRHKKKDRQSGGLSETRSGALIRRLRLSASCAAITKS
jgi:hypothetical protein